MLYFYYLLVRLYFRFTLYYKYYCYLQAESSRSTNEVHRETHDLDEEMERVFAGVSSGADPHRFGLSRFSSDRSPRPGDRRFSEDDYTGMFLLTIICVVLKKY